MRSRLVAIGLALVGLLSAAVAALAVWRRVGRDAADPPTAPVRAPAVTASSATDAPSPTPMRPDRAVVGAPPEPPSASVPPELEPHPTGAFAALGRFDYRFRRVLPLVGLAVMIGLQVWASQAGCTCWKSALRNTSAQCNA